MYAQSVVDKNPVADDAWMLAPPKGSGAGARTVAGAGEPMVWFIPKGAKNRDAAEQVIRYMVSPEIMRELFKISAGYVYPAYEWGWDDPAIKENKYAQHVTDAY